MKDTLTCSIEYQNYDAIRTEDLGYRLPVDPYWISPPQGSIVPIWHKGGGPNYQPKPLIAKHVQDPIKAWRREYPASDTNSKQGLMKTLTDAHDAIPKIRIFSCSSGVNAGKMAVKLYNTLNKLMHDADDVFTVEHEQPLNKLDLSTARPADIILIIASTTGRGEVPKNAQKFVETYSSAEPLQAAPRFSCFANGDSTYGDTYNAAGTTIEALMTKVGCKSLLGHCFAGDTALHNPDWQSFYHWLENIDHLILGNDHKIDLPTSLTDMRDKTTTLTEMPSAKLVKSHRMDPQGLMMITLDIGDSDYKEMDHLKILAPNPDNEVDRVLAVLQFAADEKLAWHHQGARDFLSRYVDLSHCFKKLEWYPDFENLSAEKQVSLKKAQVIDVLDSIKETGFFAPTMVEAICKDMASIVPRLYSVASCPEQSNVDAIQEEEGMKTVDIIVKVNPSGRFSETFLSSAKLGAQMRFALTSPDSWKLIQAQKPNAPFIGIATGSGLGPIRAVLQRRLIDISRTSGSIHNGNTPKNGLLSSLGVSRRGSVATIGSVSQQRLKQINHHAHLGVASTRGSVDLFLGFKSKDTAFIQQVIRPASDAGLLDIVEMVPTNAQQIRVQDHILLPDVKARLIEKLKDPACIVFVCANELAAEGAVVNLSILAGANVKDLLGERYIEEVFRG
jgi:sulfite reductase alpha subunit-like flavoprotein